MGNDLITLGLNETRDIVSLPAIGNPSVPLSSLSGLFSWIGANPTAAAVSVTDETAMQHLDVYTSVRVIAESCGSLPLHLMERLPSGRRIADDAEIYDLLTIAANPEMTAHTFKECIFACLASTGNCYAQIQWQDSTPIALWPLHPRFTEPFRLPDGTLAFRTTDGMQGGQYRYIGAEDMIHVSLFSLSGLKGLSPIMQAREAIGSAIATEKYAARWFGNNARPNGAFFLKDGTAKLDQKAIDQIKESIKREHGGENQGSIGFFPGSWDYKALGVTAEESQFLETKKYSRTQIAALFRLPPHYIGDTSRMSGNSTEQQSLDFVKDCLTPYLVKFEAALNWKLLPKRGRNSGRFYYKFDFNERLRGDFKTTQEGYAVQKQWGLKTTNEIRADMGLSNVGKQGDVLWVPVNMMSSERLLDAESMQEQPLPDGDVNPPIPAPATTDPDGDDSGDVETKSMAAYHRTYFPIFTDAFSRYNARSKHDLDAIQSCFRPVLQAIAGMAASNRSNNPADLLTMQDYLVDDAVKSMAKRMAKGDATAESEFKKVVRGIHIAAARDLAAAKASKELEVNEDEQAA